MKHLLGFDDKINELNKETYDRVIDIGSDRNDPRGIRLKKNALALRTKQHGGLGINFQTKDGNAFTVDLQPPFMNGTENVVFKVSGEGFGDIVMNGQDYNVNTINVQISTDMCRLWAYGTDGLGTVHIYTDRKGAGWIAKEMTNLLAKEKIYGENFKIGPSQIPQF